LYAFFKRKTSWSGANAVRIIPAAETFNLNHMPLVDFYGDSRRAAGTWAAGAVR